jgi:sugar (pentulose or hexulose) kinase
MSSARRAYLAIDAGTGGGKSVIFDSDGKRLGSHRQPWSYHVTTNPAVPLAKEFEFDAPEFWDILCHCIREALRQAGVEAHQIAGVATTSQREGCVFLNAAGREIYAGPNMDSRAFAEGIEILSEFGPERLHQITGHSAPFIFPIARYLWHRKQRPEPVAQVLMINDWLTYRLCGAMTAEPSNATESMLFDFRRRDWSEELMSKFDIPASVLPPIFASGTRVGGVGAEAAAASGLAAGTPVFVGGADTQCSLLGAGVLEQGEVGATLGTTTPVQMVVSAPTFDPEFNLWAGCHVVPDRWVIESNAGDTGDAYLWLLRLIGGDRDLEHLVALGEDLARSDTLPSVYSYIGPAIFNMTKIRIDRPGGFLFPYPLLHLRPERGELVRSFLDSIGYAIRGNCEQITRATALAPTRLTLSGGLSRSRALVQRVANIVGVPVLVAEEPESASLGCAVLIAAGCGDHADLATAAAAMVRTSQVDPEPGAHDLYAASYAKWRELNDQMEDMSI